MPTQEILYTVSGRVATVTLHRPDKLNAWTRTMEAEVRQAMREAATDDTVRVIVLTGAGRGFCAGADMSLLQDVVERRVHPLPDSARDETSANHGNAEHKDARADFERQYSYFPAIPKPVIAAINGPAVGLGLVIAMFCDLRFASEEAKFGTAFARRGLIAEYGLAWLLPKAIGHANALDLLLSARIVNAQEALRMGLVNQVFAHVKFMDGVYAYANALADSVSPRSMRVIKRQVYEAMFQTLGQALDTATEEMRASLQCEDFREGVAHFVEKRAPAFTGR
ncbi:MAG TPA: enoyl-CoA hydratase [Candidatus Solibacter sp.]|nr:enoyl-CoA hydratase [Candidatus Solibacter sp.]